MDNLTHTLTGLMLARAGLNRVTPRAAWLLVLASNLPDCDVITAMGGALTYLDHHRGITHGLAMAPLVGLAAAGIVRLFGPLPLLRAALAATVGVLFHLLMDWTNTYGIRLLLPFSGEWLRLDITNVVDVWIWALLLLGVGAPFLSGLVSGEIGGKRSSGRGMAITVLVLLLGYEVWRFTLHEQAVAAVSAHIYEGGVPRRVEAYPNLLNPWEWMTVAETAEVTVLQRISLLQRYDPRGGSVLYPPANTKAIETARNTDTLTRYLRFNAHPLWRITPVSEPEGAIRVRAADLRFADPEELRFNAWAVLDPAGRVIEENFTFGQVKPR